MHRRAELEPEQGPRPPKLLFQTNNSSSSNNTITFKAKDLMIKDSMEVNKDKAQVIKNSNLITTMMET